MRAPPAGTPGGLWRHPAPYSRRSKVQRGATAASTGNWLGLRGMAAPACVWIRRQEPGAGSPVGPRCSRRGARRVAWGMFGRLPLEKGPPLPAPLLHCLLHCLLYWLSLQPPPPRNFTPSLSPLRMISVVSRQWCCRAAMPAADVARHLWRCHRRQIAQLRPPVTGKIITFGTVLLVLHRTLYGRVSLIFPARVAGIHPHYNGIPQNGASSILPTM